MADLSVSATFDLIGIEDLAMGEGTFTRSTSTGGTQTITKINPDSLGIQTFSTPEDFGAVGDGVTDDSVALQALFDAGGSIYIPGNTYMSSRGPLVINSDFCKVLCHGTIKLMDDAHPWPFDGEEQNTTAIIHIRDCQGVTWTGGILDGGNNNGPNGMAVGHSLIFRSEPGEYCYRNLVSDIIVRNCTHNTDQDPGGLTPHDYGIGQGGGKGVTIQFGNPYVQVSNVRVYDCTIGMSYEAGVTRETDSPDVMVSNFSATDCMIGLLLKGVYGPTGGDDLGQDEFNALFTNCTFSNCGVDFEPEGIDVTATDFGVITAIKGVNVSMTNFLIRNATGTVTPFRGQFRNCYFNGEVDANKIKYVCDFRRDLNGSDPSAGESPTRHCEFDLRIKIRGDGTSGDQVSEAFITDAGTSYLTEYCRFKFSYLIGDGANDYLGNFSQITAPFYENADSDDFAQSNVWEVFDRGTGKWAMGTGILRNNSDQIKDGVTPGTFPAETQMAWGNLWVQNDVEGSMVRLKAADGTTNLGIGVPGDQSGGTAAYADSSGFRCADSLPFGLPRMTTVERDAIASPRTGMMIYNTTENRVDVYGAAAWKYITLT